MGQLQNSFDLVNMSVQIAGLLCVLLVSCALGQENSHKLPVLFQFSQPTHNVAVFRGADLKKAIAAGIVPGFGNLKNGASSDEDREGRSDDDSDATAAAAADAAAAVAADAAAADAADAAAADAAAADAAAAAVSAPKPALKIVSTYTPAPVVYKPAPVVYRPAPAPVVYRPAPAPVVYRPAPVVYKSSPAPIAYKPAPVAYKPAPVAYKPYVDPYPAEEALYTYTYGVKDDYTSNDFGTQEARDGVLTNGKYSVALPDGRIQTVTYTVNGGEGYVADVQYTGVPQYPPIDAPTYTS